MRDTSVFTKREKKIERERGKQQRSDFALKTALHIYSSFLFQKCSLWIRSVKAVKKLLSNCDWRGKQTKTDVQIDFLF